MSRPIPTVTFLFRNFSEPDQLRADRGQLPKDYFYFYHVLRNYFPVRTVSLPSSKFARAVNIVNDSFLRILFRFDIPLILLIMLLPKFRRADVIFATTPKLGISLAFFKKLGLINSQLAINICGLYDQLKKTPQLTRQFCHYVLQEADLFISGASRHETKVLADFLSLPQTKFVFTPYSGIDTHFFSPPKTKPRANFILGIGVDPARDWDTYLQIAKVLPLEKFVWATRPQLVPQLLPSNVTVKYFSAPDLRTQIRQAKIVLILTKTNHHFSGQASAFRAMSCGKPVILTENPGVDEFGLKHLKNCILVEAGNISQPVYFINRLNRYPVLSRRIGNFASLLIRRRFRYDLIGKEYVKLFRTLTLSGTP